MTRTTRIIGCAACIIVAHDCVQRATGIDPQSLFSPTHLWLWYVSAALWLFYAVGFAFVPSKL